MAAEVVGDKRLALSTPKSGLASAIAERVAGCALPGALASWKVLTAGGFSAPAAAWKRLAEAYLPRNGIAVLYLHERFSSRIAACVGWAELLMLHPSSARESTCSPDTFLNLAHELEPLLEPIVRSAAVPASVNSELSLMAWYSGKVRDWLVRQFQSAAEVSWVKVQMGSKRWRCIVHVIQEGRSRCAEGKLGAV